MWRIATNKLAPLPPKCKELIFLNALFQSGRLFVSAICVLYFLSFNLSTGDYAWIKTTQAIIFILLDIPLGYLINKVGEYKGILVSVFFALIGSFGYLVFNSFFGFVISELFLALSLSIWPVAFSTYSIKILENYKINGITERFFHCGDSISNLSILFCGCLGGFLYFFNKYLPYTCFFFFYLFIAAFCLRRLRDLRKVQVQEKIPSENWMSTIKQMASILPSASILFLTQFFMQPLLHYWQPLFEEKFRASSTDMSIIFIGYSIVMSAISWSYSRMTYVPLLRSNIFIASAAVVGGILYSCIAHSTAFTITLAFFAFSMGVFNLTQIAQSVVIQKKLKNNNRSIITKYISFYCRLGMLISQIVLHGLFSNGWKINEVYKFYGTGATFALCFYLGWIVLQTNREKNYVTESTN